MIFCIICISLCPSFLSWNNVVYGWSIIIFWHEMGFHNLLIHLDKSIRNCKGVCLLLACGQYTIYLPSYLGSLLGIVEPSDKKDIIFHHANEMTNSVIFAQIWMACSHIFTFSFDKLFCQSIFLFFKARKWPIMILFSFSIQQNFQSYLCTWPY